MQQAINMVLNAGISVAHKDVKSVDVNNLYDLFSIVTAALD